MNLIPKKSLGQHFLRSESALIKIVEVAEISNTDTVLEVGPGEGVLTEKLLQKAGKVIAIEKDARAIEALKEKFKKEISHNEFELIENDILEVSLPDVVPGEYKVVANIPYYISGLLLRYFLETVHQPTSATLLVQKEVAERIVAKDKKESILSMSVKVYGIPANKGVVKAGSFFPPPNVDSAILTINSISKDFFVSHSISEALFFEILKAGFAHKRKFVLKNLEEKGFSFPSELNQKSRAEDLTLKEWALITQKNSEENVVVK